MWSPRLLTRRRGCGTCAAKQTILDAVRECWRLLSDLEIDDRMIALDKLDDLLTMEALSHIPEAAPGRAH
jgi:hypothetical protein